MGIARIAGIVVALASAGCGGSKDRQHLADVGAVAAGADVAADAVGATADVTPDGVGVAVGATGDATAEGVGVAVGATADATAEGVGVAVGATADATAEGVAVVGATADATAEGVGVVVGDAVVDPALLARVPAEVVGLARDVGACRRVDDGYGVVGRGSDGTLTFVGAGPEPDSLGRKDRIGGCNTVPSYGLATAKIQGLRLVPRADGVSGDVHALRARALGEGLTPVANLVQASCVSRKTLRPVGGLAVLGGPLAGFVLDLVPSRNILTVKLVDARADKVETHVLGKTGVRTLEWCDRTDVAEGFCPNPAHGEVLHAALVEGQLVLTMAIGFADICGQDDLVVKAFPLPAKLARGLAPK
jgi:hypothetical protein